jgi:hypothetical protein
MTKFLAGILTIIAVGVMLVAYGLLARPADAFDALAISGVQPFGAYPGSGYPQTGGYVTVQSPQGAYTAYLTPYNAGGTPAQNFAPAAAPNGAFYAVPTAAQAPAPRAAPAARRTVVTAQVPQRDWRKTALVVGGSTAAGAGIGGIFGGKKGALIGAAIGGGASTVIESTR